MTLFQQLIFNVVILGFLAAIVYGVTHFKKHDEKQQH
jgi:hypothetical protein